MNLVVKDMNPVVKGVSLTVVVGLVFGLVTWGLGGYLSLNNNEQVVLTVMGVLFPLIFMNAVYLARLSNTHDSKIKKQRITNKGDQNLANVQNAFRRLMERSGGEDDLFCRFYLDRFSRLDTHILHSVDHDELKMDAGHQYIASSVLSVFDGKQISEFRDVWIIDNQNKMMDDHTLTYFTGLMKKIDEGKLKSIRSVMVLDAYDIDQNSEFFHILRYYHSKKELEYRLLLSRIYRTLADDSELPREFIDFGVYGGGLMFRTISYEPSTTGNFTRHPDTVQRYASFFESCWTQAKATPNDEAKSDPLTLADLVAKLDTKGKAV